MRALGVENEVVERRDPGGSRPGKRANIKRIHLEGHEKMFRDYFAEAPTYPLGMFRCRYRIQRPLFLRIMEVVCQYDPYFVQKRNAAGVLGLFSIQKCTTVLCILAYGVSPDALDKYCKMGKSTAMEAMKWYVKAIRAVRAQGHLLATTYS